MRENEPRIENPEKIKPIPQWRRTGIRMAASALGVSAVVLGIHTAEEVSEGDYITTTGLGILGISMGLGAGSVLAAEREMEKINEALLKSQERQQREAGIVHLPTGPRRLPRYKTGIK